MPGPNATAHVPLTAKEIDTMGKAMRCLGDSVPNPDFSKLVKLTEYTSEGSCKFAWSVIKAKLKYMAENGETTGAAVKSSDGDSVKKTPAKRTPKRTVKAEENDDNDMEDTPTTPVPRKRKASSTPKGEGEETKILKKARGTKAGKVKEEVVEEDEYTNGNEPLEGMNETAEEGDIENDEEQQEGEEV